MRTKIQLPPIRNQHIQRERVLRQVEVARQTRLVLVSAPAGFGKSTLLIDWAHRLREDGTLIIWYALDEGDNDPARFTAYLLDAFREHPPFTTLPEVGESVELLPVIKDILDTAAQWDHHLVLILDDYHLITTPQIHDAVNRICQYMSPNMQLVIGTRADPPLQLARLRVRGELTEIRMGDLRFNAAELREWFGQALDWQPSQHSIEAVQQMTEGWAAALALILMNQTNSDEAAFKQQLARYSQSQRHIFEYFAQEILDQQPEQIRQFLLQTCVLNRLEPDICQAITEQTDAPLLLEQLARQSLFVIPLSHTEPVYRYHHLFADFLRQYLTLADPEAYLRQHQRATAWYADHNDVVEAVNHAFAAQDFNHAVTLIEQEAWPVLNTRGEFMTLVNWLPHVPEESLKQHLRLWLHFVHALYLTGHVELAEDHVHRAVEVLNQEESPDDSKQALRAIAYNYQATLAVYRGNMHTAMSLNERAKALQDWVELSDRLRIVNGSAFIRYFMGHVPEAGRGYQEALALAEQLNHHYQILDIHFYLAQLDFLAGNLTAAQNRCEDLIARYTNRYLAVIPLRLPLAKVQYQRNHVVEAEANLRDMILLARQANLPDSVFFANITLSDLLLSRGEMDQAASCIFQARQFAQQYDSPMVDSLIAAAEARYWLRLGQLEDAGDWAAWYQKTESGGYCRDDENLTLAQVRLAQGEHIQALSLLESIIESARGGGRTFYVIQVELLRSRTYDALGKKDEAQAALEQALILAEAGGIIRLFLDMGHPVHKLMRQGAERGNRYAAQLVDIAASMERVQHPADVLTERELEVLQYIADGASNRAIAKVLVLSVGTVKSHVHHIMGKLGVKNRTEAVSKARSLNILPD